jgi:sigma-B regulation protein RsbU (phosphoserine phosphatase)
MPARLKLLWQRLARIEKAFLLVLLLYIILALATPASAFRLLLLIAVWTLGIAAAFRLVRRHAPEIIWRLRNRLIVAYAFIAVVPVLLIVVLVASATFVIAAQTAVYLITSELDRRIALLAAAAEHPDSLDNVLPFLRTRFPNVQVASTPGLPQASGLILKDGQLYSWAHAARAGHDVTLLAPITHDFLIGLIPGLGDVLVLSRSGSLQRLDARGQSEADHVPPPAAGVDPKVTGVSVLSVASWDAPKTTRESLLVVTSRTSAVLAIVFGEKFDFGQAAVLAFIAIAILFLLFEIGSLIVGVSLTRTITGAVHNLYEGTQRVSHGDFSHRIAVHGNDQLADLGTSFNQMTANLERLIVVEKEKERLQSELEIAHQVQMQLFPKENPVLRTAQVLGVCHPARVVSGDYYDFLALSDSTLALAIGDVAGKGISAALLMAAIQSTMRTQLSAATSVAAAAGNGRQQYQQLDSARLVAQLNKQLYANTSPEKFATFCFGLYDESRSVLKYTNAGHVPPILMRHGEPYAELGVTGTVVGAFPFSRYEEQEIELHAGDLLVAYTDGMVEPENPYGEQFGEDRLKDLLVKYAAQPSEEIIARVMESVEQWTGSTELQDDMTMLVVRRI